MNIKKLAFLVLIVAVLTAACQPAVPTISAKDEAATTVAETAEAAPPTEEPTAVPTETPAPTATVTVTPTITLTATPTGPLKITDDFSTKSDIWGKCDKCEWKDGKLVIGPYSPRGDGINQVFAIICEACGDHTYFRVAADITFADGFGDRFFGVGVVEPDKFYAGMGISTVKYGMMEAYNFETKEWTGMDRPKPYAALKAGKLTNHIEFIAKPNASGGTDFYGIANGKNLMVLSNIIKRSMTGIKPAIYLAWHSVGISVDNFEYEEIEP